MGHIAAKVTSNDAIPSRSVLLVKFTLQMLRNVLLHVELLQCVNCQVDCLHLHVFCHVRALDDGLGVSTMLDDSQEKVTKCDAYDMLGNFVGFRILWVTDTNRLFLRPRARLTR